MGLAQAVCLRVVCGGWRFSVGFDLSGSGGRAGSEERTHSS
jgi:hypothetical protein